MTDDNGQRTVDRRTLLASTGGLAALGLAGCLTINRDDQHPAPGDGELPNPEGEDVESENYEYNGDDTEEEDDGSPSVEDHLDGANLYDGNLEDHTGEDEVRVTVGAGDGLAFDPPAIQVDPGTTVVWEWTGEGGRHNVTAEEGGDFQSETTQEEGHTFEHQFEEAATVLYVCTPHRAAGMRGAVVVGDGGGGDGGDGGDGDSGASVENHLDGANLYDGNLADHTGEDAVTVTVGAGDGLAFDPPAITVSSGTTVTWEWTGEGGRHNVTAEEGGDFQSETTQEEGHTFEHQFEEAGEVLYVCTPHRAAGMRGAVVVEE